VAGVAPYGVDVASEVDAAIVGAGHNDLGPATLLNRAAEVSACSSAVTASAAAASPSARLLGAMHWRGQQQRDRYR
jgi:hypothetical protein